MDAKYVVFDLDDTLCLEIEYLESAFLEISKHIDSLNYLTVYEEMIAEYSSGNNPFENICSKFINHNVQELLEIYRNHYPLLKLNDGAGELLNHCLLKGYKIGLITDGRSVTQRNKLKSLGIFSFFDKIIISEEFGSTKPNLANFEAFSTVNISKYYYIADNPLKDFIVPNILGWTSICLLDSGRNIHKQDFNIDNNKLPLHRVKILSEVINLIENDI